ncbi:hypothetical protein IMG5_182000 [Ichthyophthirius multifiliis]|uniref:Uncharacterized protein n=1 Tax=Ichthyophthirius multifiliis TaxID=5932 RepID=G0R2Z3_ICHMU|nr:hypothetical protein IMG5_182000 [Ichthyophthirius multifiliis]EGR28153.1 hypothetical protein IMG5_182000 [Ichthyophthirius multifiliis]|eukprot:XP_004027498.1 hypothetical protein IMG5_182000 [Ichthyophthirius multifiliis]
MKQSKIRGFLKDFFRFLNKDNVNLKITVFMNQIKKCIEIPVEIYFEILQYRQKICSFQLIC